MDIKIDELFARLAKESPMFHYLDDQHIDTLIQYLEFRQLNRGEVIFREGEPGDFVIFISRGSIEVSTQNPGGDPFTLAQLGWGTSVGEMALIDELPRSATAHVVDDSDFFMLSRESFNNILQNQPQLAVKLLMGLAWTISLRLRYNSRRLIDHVPL